MDRRLITDVEALVAAIEFPRQKDSTVNNYVFGESFVMNINTKQVIRSVSKKIITNDLILAAKKEKPAFSGMTGQERLQIFATLYNYYFDSQSEKLYTDYEHHLKTAASMLKISREDVGMVTEFFFNSTPYSDTNNALYIVNGHANPLVKATGANIHLRNFSDQNIYYIKYFHKQATALCKVLGANIPYNFILPQIKVREIHVVCEDCYSPPEIGLLNFFEISSLLKNHLPFQFIAAPATDNQPRIVLDPEQSIIEISGRSTPLSPINYFEPVLRWLENYAKYGKPRLTIQLKLDIFNTYTSKFLMQLIKTCNQLNHEGKSVKFRWYYDDEDEDMKEFGFNLRHYYNETLNFKIISTKNTINK